MHLFKNKGLFQKISPLRRLVSRPGDKAPVFTADAVVNNQIKKLNMADYAGKWVYFFFYPKDFTYVCPTEIIAFSEREKEFAEKNCQIIGASVDSAEVHLAWIKTPRDNGGLGGISYPLVADLNKKIAREFNVLNEEIGIAYRGSFLIDPSGVVQQLTVNNFPVGRSVDEALRLLEAFQFTAEHGEVCPADFKAGISKSMKADPNASKSYFKDAFQTAAPTTNMASADLLKNITTQKELDGLIKNNDKVVLQYSASWCNSCKKIAPFVSDLASSNASVSFAKIDTSDYPELSDVTNLPTFKIFSNGHQVGSDIVGANKDKLQEALKNL